MKKTDKPVVPERAKGELLNQMLVLATNRHAGQYDRGGRPYILHPLAVMCLLNTEDEELQCIALGHDLIEDTGLTYKELYDLGFPTRVIRGIRCLTKMPGQTPDEYLETVMSNFDAVKVKKADLTHNSDIRRLKGIRDKDIERMAEYHKMFLILDEYENQCEGQ